MMGRQRIVVSAENNPFVGWQAKLFYFSCVSRLNRQPLFVVHDTGKPWHRDFRDLVAAGGEVLGAPSYRADTADGYPPRNTAGTLLRAADACEGREEFIVLCDPDMVFARRPSFPETLSGEYYSYLDYRREEVRLAARRIGVSIEEVWAREHELSCGVPYVIPVSEARRVAAAWLEAIDAFTPPQRGDMMHAFGLAAVKLGLEVTLTRTTDHNYWPREKLTREVIHYCYGDETWNKRDYFYEGRAREVWTPRVEVARETILGELLSQIKEAREFYRDLFLEKPGPHMNRTIQGNSQDRQDEDTG